MTARSVPDGSVSRPAAFQKKLSQPSNFSYVAGRLSARMREFFTPSELDGLDGAPLGEFERRILASSYGPPYRRDFSLAAGPVSFRLDSMLTAETSRRLADLVRLSLGETALAACLLGVLSDLPLGLAFLRNLAFRHPTPPRQRPCFGVLDQAFWHRLWADCADMGRVETICNEHASPHAPLLLLSVDRALSQGRLDGEMAWADGLLALAFHWLDESGLSGRTLRPFIEQYTDAWNYRIWAMRQQGNADVPFLSIHGELRPDVLASAKTERALFAGTVWRSLRSPEHRHTAQDMERDLLGRMTRLNRSDPLGAGLMASYAARQLLEYERLSSRIRQLAGAER